MANYFYLKDGRIIKTIEELPDILENISDEIFYSHVDNNKNDFSKWVYDSFNNVELSKLIGSIKNKEEIIRTIRAYLKTKEIKQETKINEKEMIIKENETEKKYDSSNNINLMEEKNIEYSENKNQNKKENMKINENTNEKIKNKIENNEKNITEKITELVDEKKKIENQNNNPDDFFKENPVLIEQIIEAKKEKIVLEPLSFIDYDKNDTKKNIETFKDNYAKAYQRLSFLRKSGFDTSLAEMMLFRVLPKIKLYEASNEEKDALIVKRFLNETIEELNNLK
ncbi:MAG: hypothetical protein QXM96_00335 [Candidatus Woesearchaeota archaeon]